MMDMPRPKKAPTLWMKIFGPIIVKERYVRGDISEAQLAQDWGLTPATLNRMVNDDQERHFVNTFELIDKGLKQESGWTKWLWNYCHEPGKDIELRMHLKKGGYGRIVLDGPEEKDVGYDGVVGNAIWVPYAIGLDDVRSPSRECLVPEFLTKGGDVLVVKIKEPIQVPFCHVIAESGLLITRGVEPEDGDVVIADIDGTIRVVQYEVFDAIKVYRCDMGRFTAEGVKIYGVVDGIVFKRRMAQWHESSRLRESKQRPASGEGSINSCSA